MIRVLLAEDQAMVRGALSALLRLESDMDVVASAADGQEAWKLIEQHKPDVVVYDLIPPYERQWQFLDHLRQTSPLNGIPFVITSCNEKAARELGGRDELVHEVLGRPFDVAALIDAVRRAAKVEKATE